MAPMKLSVRRRGRDKLFDSYPLSYLARRLHLTRRQIRKLLEKGELPFVEVHGEIRVPRWAIIFQTRGKSK